MLILHSMLSPTFYFPLKSNFVYILYFPCIHLLFSFIRLPWLMTSLPFSWNIPVHSSLCCQSYLPKHRSSSVLHLGQLTTVHSIKPHIPSLVFKGSVLCCFLFIQLTSQYTMDILLVQLSRFHWPPPENVLHFVSCLLCSLCLECALFQYLPIHSWSLFKKRSQEVSAIPTHPHLLIWLTLSMPARVRIP